MVRSTRPGRPGGLARGALLAALLTVMLAPAASCTRSGRKPEPARGAVAAAVPERPKHPRLPAVAGSWYPDDEGALAAEIDRMLDRAPEPAAIDAPVRALVVPHAGYRFSGATAATAFRLVRGASYKRVIVLGPAHQGSFRGASVLDLTHYRTPLGDVPVDLGVVGALRQDRLVAAHPDEDRPEHSIEIELPFLQRALKPGWELVPILIGRLEPGDAHRLAEVIRPFADEDTLVVASGDFTHYGQGYRFQPFPVDARIQERLAALDMGFFERMAAIDPEGLVDYEAKTGASVCGYHGFLVLTHLLPPNSRATLLRYDSSGAQAGDFTTSVSYVAAAFTSPTAPRQADEVLSRDELVLLHRLAVRAVALSVRSGADAGDEAADGLDLGPRLNRPSGTFVTLKKDGQLRGCIGSITAREALWRAVIHAADSAALHDTRFDPVRPEELPALTVEVSVLSPLRSIPGWEAFRVGEQGIYLTKDGHGAVYLPEVAREQGWTREETLSHLARKAGLAADAWREGASFQVFTSQIYEAPFAAGK